MALSIQAEQGRSFSTTLRLTGRLDNESVDELDREVDKLLDSPLKALVFDLSGLEYITSAGLRTFFRAKKSMKQRAGKALFLNPQPQVRKSLRHRQGGRSRRGVPGRAGARRVPRRDAEARHGGRRVGPARGPPRSGPRRRRPITRAAMMSVKEIGRRAGGLVLAAIAASACATASNYLHPEGPLYLGGRAAWRVLSQAGGDGEPVVVVPAGVPQAARPMGDYTLSACLVEPGFVFGDFSLPSREELVAEFPEESERIRALTR